MSSVTFVDSGIGEAVSTSVHCSDHCPMKTENFLLGPEGTG